MVCFKEFTDDDKRVYCCHCDKQICRPCYSNYIENNAGWCPCCRQHLLFEGLKQADDPEPEFERFIKRATLYETIRNPYVRAVPDDKLFYNWILYKNYKNSCYGYRDTLSSDDEE
jgi:hypothetical protein